MNASTSDAAKSGFVADLAALVGRGTLHGLAAAAQAVSDDPDAFGGWLETSFRDIEVARATAARSYWHPNGFAKLVLYTSTEPEFKIRMHVWSESGSSRRGETNPHSHRWEFASTLITGQGILLPEYGEVVEGGEQFTRYRYGTNPADPALLVDDGTVRLAKVRSSRLSRGGLYTCGTEVVHTAEPVGEQLTATLVVQGRHRTSTTAVFRSPGETDEQPNRPLPVTDLLRLVKAVVTEVRGCSSRR
jgi:hypothetical protein